MCEIVCKIVAVGKVWVNVADFVDKNQVDHANLDYGGYQIVAKYNLCYLVYSRQK